ALTMQADALTMQADALTKRAKCLIKSKRVTFCTAAYFTPLSTVRGYGTQFEDAGFIFTRAGTRKRGEVACSVIIS
nr:hypothetical protein [Nostoc sp. DedQUE03]